MICGIREARECGCEGVCPQQRRDLPPVRTATKRDMIAVIVFGMVIAGLAAGTMNALNRMEIQLKQEARI